MAWSYYRIKGLAPGNWFRQFYAGRYTSFVAAGTPREGLGALGEGGMATDPITTAAQPDDWTAAAPVFGQDSNTGSYTDNFPPLQVYNVGLANGIVSHWPNALLTPVSGTPPKYTDSITNSTVINPTVVPASPFGTFTRNGDMLDIPFIGAYRISLASNGLEPIAFVELNSLTKDCSFADATYSDTDVADQSVENIGRFCPIRQASLQPQVGHSPTITPGPGIFLPT